MGRPSLRLLLCLCFLGTAGARADIYSYTDEHGVIHFTNVPTDRRFEVILKAPPEERPTLLAAVPVSDWRERAAGYAGLINREAHLAALQPALLRAVIAIESAFDPAAVSRAGAQGLMQLHPTTARRYGVRDPFDPAQNLRGGARYLSYLIKRYDNNLELALAAYNAGEDAVDRHGRKIPPYRETRAYVPAVLKLYRKFLAQVT